MYLKCENLEVWKKASALSADIYVKMANLRDFGFKDQLTRSGLSIPSNIAEGLERISDQEKIRFLDIARASLAEAKTQIYIGMKIDYIEREMGKKWVQELESIGKMISALIKTIGNNLEQRKND
jgi:four helix bundle protein